MNQVKNVVGLACEVLAYRELRNFINTARHQYEGEGYYQLELIFKKLDEIEERLDPDGES